MRFFSFGNDRKRDELLSAYLDGELNMDGNAEVEERMVMEPESTDRLALLERTALLADAALVPQSLADTDAFADRLMDQLGQTVTPTPAPRRPLPRRLGSTAVLASVGLIVTAGVTLVGLRRRGVV